jgi:hypothetical protein
LDSGKKKKMQKKPIELVSPNPQFGNKAFPDPFVVNDYGMGIEPYTLVGETD